MSIEAMKQALEALDLSHPRFGIGTAKHIAATAALRQAIAEAEKQQDIFKQLGSQSMLQLWQSYCDVKVERDELKNKLAEAKKQEPVGHADLGIDNIYLFNDQEQRVIPEGRQALYTHPYKREPLTDEEIATISIECATVSPSDIYFARAIEAAHGIKENT